METEDGGNKPVTWDDIIDRLKNAVHDENGSENPERFAALKKSMLDHLDRLENEPVDTGRITVISKWDDTIAEKAYDFKEERGVWPNILLANLKTFERIDNYLKKHPENLNYTGVGEPPEFDGLSCFATADYELVFCIDNDLEKNVFKLVFDEDPVFDGEETEDSVKSRFRTLGRHKSSLRKAA